MGVLEDAKKLAERGTGIGRPKGRDLPGFVRDRKATTFRFSDDGSVPNHPRWPLVLYRSAVRLAPGLDPAAIFEDLFERNGWADSWRNGVYDYLHYHSRIHEVMGVARGTAVVRFGGTRGRKLRLNAGDVLVLPSRHGPPVPVGRQGFSRRRRVSGQRDIQRLPSYCEGARARPEHRPEGAATAQRPGLCEGRRASALVETPARQEDKQDQESEARETEGRAAASLKRDCFSLNRNHALAVCSSMIFSENRHPLFGIMR